MLAALTIAEWPALKPISHATLGRLELTAPSFPVAASRSIAISSVTCAELPFRLKKPAATNCLLTSVARLSCAQSELASAMMYSTAACCVAQSTPYGILTTISRYYLGVSSAIFGHILSLGCGHLVHLEQISLTGHR